MEQRNVTRWLLPLLLCKECFNCKIIFSLIETKIWAWSDNYKSHWIMMNIGNKQNSWKKIKDIAIWPLLVYVYYKTGTSIIFNTFLCLARKCRTKLIELFDFFIRVLFVTQNCLQWKLCSACFFPKQEMYDQERHIKFGGHLGGFGADMFEAEINKLKEKNRTLCLPSRSLTVSYTHLTLPTIYSV